MISAGASPRPRRKRRLKAENDIPMYLATAGARMGVGRGFAEGGAGGLAR